MSSGPSDEDKSQGKKWVQFDEEEAKSSEAANDTKKSASPAKSESTPPAVIPTESVQITLERSRISPLPPDPTDSPAVVEVDLNDASNGTSVVNTTIGAIRQGFANGDIIVTLLPVNTRFPWITPAKFRPELVPEELMAQGLSLTVEDYVHVMEILTNDMRFTVYNICYKRVLVVWIFTAFVILLGLLFSGLTGLTLFGFGVLWLLFNAAAIFLCMWIKIKLNRNLERCMANVNKHLLRHKIILGLDDRGKISCHKVNLCFIYFDTTECIKKLREVIEREEAAGRVVNSEEANDKKRKKENDLASRMDIEDHDIIIQGSRTVRVSMKQERANRLLLRYASRWVKLLVRHQLDLGERGSGPAGLTAPRHSALTACLCQYIEKHLKYKPRGKWNLFKIFSLPDFPMN